MTEPDADWFADEALWEALYPFLFSDASRASAIADVEAIGSLVERPVEAVLDMCCGPGRHSVSFAKRGKRVTGVDRSSFLLGRAREYASSAGVEIRWVQRDMREFVEPGAFDLAVNLFTSFGYFDDPAENQRVLANIRASLVPGGALVLDTVGKEVVARIFQPSRVQDLADGAVLVQRANVIDDWARIENEWVLIRSGEARSFRFRHWVYSAVELRDMLKDAGFASVDVFGGFDGSHYGVDSSRLVTRAYNGG